MNKNFRLSIFFFLLISLFSFPQNERKVKKTFIDAEYHLLYNEYNEALPLFLELYDGGKKTPNIMYRIGQCYLHKKGEKDKAIAYLENATQNLTNQYETGHFEESEAPLKALYYLGIAYRINNMMDKAMETFRAYKKQVEGNNEETRLVNAQIKACKTANKLKRTPTNVLEKNLGKKINSSFPNINPVVSGDETAMVFLSELKFYKGIFFSRKINGKWISAKNISLDFESPRPLEPVHLSYDGKTLYLVRNDNNDYNIYISRFERNQWTPVEKLSDRINSDAFERYASTTKDGNILYFTSNREGGFGGYDIYRSFKDENGEWSPPINLGSTINTSFDEATPFLTENRKKLYFSSKGHNNMGGFDVFYSKQNNGSWKKPVNLGFPINTTDNDLFFFPLQNGKIAYYSKIKPNGYGNMDIYKLNLYERENIPEKEKHIEISELDSNP